MANRAIDRVIAHYAATKARRFEIATAWGFPVFVSPWTLGEKDRVFDVGSYRPRTNARVLVVKAEDQAGNRLFADVEERELLNEADPDEVNRIAHEIMRLLNEDNAAAREPDGEDAAPKA